MRKAVTAVILLALAPLALAGLDADLTSTNPDVTITGIDGFVIDDLLGVEVAHKFGAEWVWPAIEVQFAPIDISSGAETLDITSRIYREIGTYDDAHLWVLVYDGLDVEWDLGWGDNYDDDSWRVENRALAGIPGDFDATTLSKILVRSTNWGGQADPDFYRFSHLTITPEPASMALLIIGSLVMVRRR